MWQGVPVAARLDGMLDILHVALLICSLLFSTLLYTLGSWSFRPGLPCHWPLVVFDQWEHLTEDLTTEECDGWVYKPLNLPCQVPTDGEGVFAAISGWVLVGWPSSCFQALSFRNCSFPYYSFYPRGGNHSSLTPVVPKFYIISLFPNIYYNKSSYYYNKVPLLIILKIAFFIPYPPMTDKGG